MITSCAMIIKGNMMDNNKHTTICTAGEELYRIHLQRLRDEEEDDHDHPPRKRRSSSIGEELWEIHKKRSLGIIEDDPDNRDIDDSDKNKDDDPAQPTKKEWDTPKCCRYNLRSKDVSSIKKI